MKTLESIQKKLKIHARIETGPEGDNILDCESISTNSLDMTRREYEAMEKNINSFKLNGHGFYVYVWNDSSGYNYWTKQQEEDNYIQVTAVITDVKKVKVSDLNNALEAATAHFSKYARYM